MIFNTVREAEDAQKALDGSKLVCDLMLVYGELAGCPFLNQMANFEVSWFRPNGAGERS